MSKPIITRELAPLPERSDDAHKGDMGRVVIIGGCCDEVMMLGAPALAAIAAFRAGAGLVQLFVPEPIRAAVGALAPCATMRTLPVDGSALLAAIGAFKADVVAVGPGLGRSLDADALETLLCEYAGPMVVDADGLNLLATTKSFDIPNAPRVVLTPHPGELRRLLAGRGRKDTFGRDQATRCAAACDLVATYGCAVVLKGHATIVTNGDRLYVNETGNAGMATGGSGDLLTGVVAGLIGQGMEPFEAAMLGVYLHGLAGDFASEELGRHSVTATDLVEFLPEAFCEHVLAESS